MSIGFRVACIAAAFVVGASAARAQAPVQPVPLDAYGDLPGVELVETSPSGERMALVTVAGEDRVLVIIDPRHSQLLGRISVGLAKVRALDWIGDGALMITTSTTQALEELGLGKRELLLAQIYDLDRRRLVSVLQDMPGLAPMLYGVPFVTRTDQGPVAFARAHAIGNRRADLFRIDPATGRGRPAVDLTDDVESLVLDAAGAPFARATYDEVKGDWRLDFWKDGAFSNVWSTTSPLDSPGLGRGLGRDGRSVLVSARRADAETSADEAGFAWYEVDAEGTWTPVPFADRPSQLLYHPKTRRLIGYVHREEEGLAYAFFDPEAADVWEQVADAFPDQSPELINWSDDLQTVLVHTSGSGDAGSYHMVDMARLKMSTVGQAYPAVTSGQVAPIEPVVYTAADGLEIRGYLTTPPGVTNPRGLPLVVLAHGGPAEHDEMGFDWWAQALASRGYAVLQPNFRGSTGYGQEFLEAGYGEWGRKMQTDLSDGVRWLASEGVIDPARVCIVGASYGGYAALAGPTLDPGVYRCAVSVAGVSDLRRLVARAAGQGRRSNNESVRYWNRFMGADGPGDRSLDARSPLHLADRADAPILLLHGRDDTVVPIEQSRLMAQALRAAGKPVEMIELAGEDHWLSRADTRRRMLAETVRFLEAHNPPR